MSSQIPNSTELDRLIYQKNNAILVCHAISGDSHVAKHDEEDIDGWWDIFVGPGKYIDTNNDLKQE